MTRSWVILAGLVAGCVSTPDRGWHWDRDDHPPPAALRMDDGQCRAQAGGASSLMQFAVIYDGCMTGKGWVRVSN